MNIFNILNGPISNFFYIFLFQLSNCNLFYWQINTYLLGQKEPNEKKFSDF